MPGSQQVVGLIPLVTHFGQAPSPSRRSQIPRRLRRRPLQWPTTQGMLSTISQMTPWRY